MNKKDIKKVVLAYSGGLDTSIIIPWLKENYNNPEIIAVSGNVGQASELEGLEEKAIKTGASKCYIEDLTEEFLTDYVFPCVQAGALYEDYMLGTAFARPPIAKSTFSPQLRLAQFTRASTFSVHHSLVLSLQKDLLKSLKKRVLTLSATAVQVRVTIRFVLSLLSRHSFPICLLSLLGVSGISNPVRKK